MKDMYFADSLVGRPALSAADFSADAASGAAGAPLVGFALVNTRVQQFQHFTVTVAAGAAFFHRQVCTVHDGTRQSDSRTPRHVFGLFTAADLYIEARHKKLADIFGIDSAEVRLPLS
jgi:hypothetical protein